MWIFNDYGIDIGYVVLGLSAACLVMLILLIILVCKQVKLKKRYLKFMQGEDAKSLEEDFAERFKFIEEMKEKSTIIFDRLDKIEYILKNTYQKVGIVKYDAFHEMGGQLSFVLAMLTDQNDGYVINAVHSSREGCFVYIKEIKKGVCDIILSEEEDEALKKAIAADVKKYLS